MVAVVEFLTGNEGHLIPAGRCVGSKLAERLTHMNSRSWRELNRTGLIWGHDFCLVESLGMTPAFTRALAVSSHGYTFPVPAVADHASQAAVSSAQQPKLG